MNTSIILFDLVTKGNLVYIICILLSIFLWLWAVVVVVVWWLDLQLPM